jgi:hypothetical protein
MVSSHEQPKKVYFHIHVCILLHQLLQLPPVSFVVPFYASSMALL